MTTQRHRVTLIPGDGIGPEVTEAARRVIEAAGVGIDWEPAVAGMQALEQFRTPLPEETVRSIRRTKVCLKGPLTTPVGRGFTSVNVALRRLLKLFANLRPIQSLPGLETHFGPLDLIVIRENTEDLYSGIEHVVAPGVVESVKVITARASKRIATFAFELAQRQRRRKVTAIHKANIMKLSDGLFLDCARKVAAKFPHLTYEEVIVDNACLQLVRHPQQFDILLLENLYGDIVSDLCAGLVGGLGIVPGANLGKSCAIFEAVHGSAPDIAGKNRANPLALIRSAIMMLEHLGESRAAKRIADAIMTVVQQRANLTPDLGGSAGTNELAEAIIRALPR